MINYLYILNCVWKARRFSWVVESGVATNLATACVLRYQDTTPEFINRVRNCEDRERGKRYCGKLG